MMRRTHTRLFAILAGWLPVLTVVLSASAIAQDAAPTQLAGQILDATGVQGGLIVHLGVGDGRLTAALRASDSFQVQGLDREAANVDKARRNIQSQGLYGEISVDQLAGDKLPYIDNLINLVVADDLSGITMKEV